MITTVKEVMDLWISGDVVRAQSRRGRVFFDCNVSDMLMIDNQRVAQRVRVSLWDPRSQGRSLTPRTRIVFIASHWAFDSHNILHPKLRDTARCEGAYLIRQQNLLKKRLDDAGVHHVTLPTKSFLDPYNRLLSTLEEANRFWRMLMMHFETQTYTPRFLKQIVKDANKIAHVFDLEVCQNITTDTALDAVQLYDVRQRLTARG